MIQQPANSRRITCKISGAFCFVYEDARGRPCAHAYTKTAKKHPAWRFYFSKPEQRDAKVAAFLASQAARAQEQAARRQKSSDGHTLEVGHVFYNSWGYEQTNIDFYQVVRVTRCGVFVRPVKSKQTDTTGWLTGKVVPDIGNFSGPETFKRVERGTISMRHGGCYPWDGRPVNYTAYH